MTKKVSKRWTEVEAQQVLAEQVRSGLSDRAFARKKGLDPQRLWWWRKRLEQSGQDEAVAFVEVKPKPVVTTRVEVLEVQLINGRVVSVSAAIDPMMLARLLDAIEGRSC
jgi:transposase-like protein